MIKLKKIITLFSLSILTVAVIGCQKNKKITEIIYVEWSSEIATTAVVKEAIESHLDYKVKLTPVTAASMYEGIASGDGDAIVSAWLPTTHKHYMNKIKGKVEDLGPNLKGTKIGLVVPSYVKINSITELNKNAEKFKGKIIGIDSGAGLMEKTEKALKVYGLTNFELIDGSEPAMTASLKDAIKNKEWIVVTGWTPHWKFAKWELKYLNDPKNIYGGEEYVKTLVRKGFKKEKPDLYKFFDKFNWTPSDMEQVLVWNQEKNSDPAENAKKWIKQNKQKVDSWFK